MLGVLATFASALPLAITAHGRDASAAVFFTVWVLFCGLIIGHDDRAFARFGLEGSRDDGNGLDEIASGNGGGRRIRRSDSPCF